MQINFIKKNLSSDTPQLNEPCPWKIWKSTPALSNNDEIQRTYIKDKNESKINNVPNC